MAQNLIRLKQLNTSELSGFFASTATNTGAFASILSSANIVYQTGNQTISGTKTFDVSPIISGSPFITGVNLSSYATASNLTSTGTTLDTKINSLSGVTVLTFGNQTINGSKIFSDSGIFSLSGTSALIVQNNPLSIVGSGNTYIQTNIQNRATGTNATADLVITANNGTDSSNFINLGINNSGYNDPTFTNGGAYDGYLFINGGDLDIGTQTAGKSIEFHAGGTTQDKTIARISSSGLNIISGNINFSPTNYISGNYINLRSTSILTGTNKTGEALLSIRAGSTRSILNQTDGFGASFSYQPGLIERNNMSYYFANAGSASANNINLSLNTVINGNATNIRKAINIGTTSYFDATKRIGYTGNPSASTPSSYGLTPATASDLLYFRGTNGYGGFYMKARFGLGDMSATIPGKARAFIGMSDIVSPAVVCSTQPSLRAQNLLGMGFDSGDNNWFFIHNSGATANATKISLGNYTNLIKSGNILELSIYATPDSGVGFHANIANSGNIYETGYYTTTNIPPTTTLLGPNLSVYNSDATVGGLELVVNGIYLESFL